MNWSWTQYKESLGLLVRLMYHSAVFIVDRSWFNIEQVLN